MFSNENFDFMHLANQQISRLGTLNLFPIEVQFPIALHMFPLDNITSRVAARRIRSVREISRSQFLLGFPKKVVGGSVEVPLILLRSCALGAACVIDAGTCLPQPQRASQDLRSFDVQQ